MNTIHVGGKNGQKGDYIRVIVHGETAPVAQDDTGVVNEDATLVVADGTNLTSVDSATVDGSPLNVASQLPAMRGITFNTDGTKMFLTGTESRAVSEYPVSYTHLTLPTS